MSYEPPTPPAELPTDIVNTLNRYSADQLRHIASYAEELAEHKARVARLEEESDEDDQRQPLLRLAVERGRQNQVEI